MPEPPSKHVDAIYIYIYIVQQDTQCDFTE